MLRKKKKFSAADGMSSSKYLSLVRQLWSGLSKTNFQRVGNKCRVVSADEGRCVVELDVEEEHTNPNQTLHGGLTATLVDMVTTSALMATEKAHPGVSTDLSVSYLNAAPVGETIVIDGKVLKSGRTLAFTSADVYRKKDKKLIAIGHHTKAFPP